MISFRAAVALVLMVGVLGAAGLVWQARNDGTGVLSRPDAEPGICDVLDEGTRRELLGMEAGTRMLNVEGSLDRFTCRYANTDVPEGAYVQVVSAPADAWAGEIAAAPSNGNPQAQALIRAARAAGADPEQACRVALDLYRTGGARPGADRLVQASTSSTGNPMVMGQSCVGGVFTSVSVTAPTLRVDRALQRRTADALRKVERQMG